MSQQLADICTRRFADDRFATEVLGIEIRDAYREMDGEEVVVCEMTLRPDMMNARGFLMGGALFSLADFTFAVASNLDCAAENKPLEWVSNESHIHYLRPVSGGTLQATTHCVKKGRNSCLYRIDVTDDAHRIVAAIETSGTRVHEL